MTTAAHRRRKDRPGGASWHDAQLNAPGAYVKDHKHGTRSKQSEAIIAWMRGRGRVTSQQVHFAVFGDGRWPLWSPGATTSRLGSFVSQGWIKRYPGGIFEMVGEPPPERYK